MSYDHPAYNDPHNTWTISTPVAGITLTALMVVSTASAIPIVGVNNPPTNRNHLIVRRAVALQVTGTVVNFIWGVIPATTAAIAVATASAYRHSDFVSTGHTGKYFAGATAVVGTPVNFRPLGGPVAGATAASFDLTYDELVDGSIRVAPGATVGLFADTTTSTAVVRASLTVCEIPN